MRENILLQREIIFFSFWWTKIEFSTTATREPFLYVHLIMAQNFSPHLDVAAPVKRQSDDDFWQDDGAVGDRPHDVTSG